MARPFVDLTGRKFGRWTVVGPGGRGQRLCRCECGTERIVRTDVLANGRSHSCGCLNREIITSHGESRCGPNPSKEYHTWVSMKDRCLSPNNKDWPKYGGRGIRIHPDWIEDYQAFLAHVGRAPSKTHVIDRIDVDGHYEPGNLRWATPSQSVSNRRCSRPDIPHDEVRARYATGTISLRALGEFYKCNKEWIRKIVTAGLQPAKEGG
jgi:hypothetical protein